MPQSGKLLAWIDRENDHTVVAAFVGAAAKNTRAPATRVCASRDEARRWVEAEASAFGLPVEWVDPTETR